MTFSDEILKNNSERSILFMMKPSRFVSNMLVNQGGGIYTLTMSRKVHSVSANDTNFTEVFVTPTANNTFYYNDTTKLLTLKIASAPNDTDNFVVIGYYLLYSSKINSYWDLDPEGIGTEYLWDSKIISEPSSKQSSAYSVKGNLSISVSGVSIDDSNDEFVDFLSENDSFNNKECFVWSVVNNQVRKLFSGLASSVQKKGNNVQIVFQDALLKLKTPCFMGDSAQKAYFLKETGSFPNMYESDSGKAIPYIIGRSPAYVGNSEWLPGDSGGFFPNNLTSFTITEERSNKAVCTDFSGASDYSKSNNREWGICRTSFSSFKTLDFGSMTSAIVYGGIPGPKIFYLGASKASLYVLSTGHNLEIGDSFKIIRTATSYWATVTDASATSFSCLLQNHTSSASNEDWIASTSYYSNKAPGIIIKQANELFLPVYERDFFKTEFLLSSGNTYMKITFNNNFEANHSGLNGLNPSEHSIHYRATEKNNSSYKNQEKALERILIKGGALVDSASILQAGLDLDEDVQMSIPEFDETEYKDYLHYAERITQSTFGYLGVNVSGRFFYNIMKAPTAGSSRDDNINLNNSVKSKINYKDSVTKLIASNKHDFYFDKETTSSVSIENLKAKYLDGISKEVKFDHVLKDISGRLPFILDSLSSREIIYEWKTATKDLDTEIGDVITLISSEVLGGSGSVNIRVFSLNKGNDFTTIKAVPLEGL